MPSFFLARVVQAVECEPGGDRSIPAYLRITLTPRKEGRKRGDWFQLFFEPLNADTPQTRASLDFSVCESAKSLLCLVLLWSGFSVICNGESLDEPVSEAAMDQMFVSPPKSVC